MWLFPGGAVAAVLLAGGVPVSPGLYPVLSEQRRTELPRAEEQWHAMELLQRRAFEERGDRISDQFQLAFTGGFFALLPLIHTLALLTFGATVAGWCGLVFATFLVSRRAGGEAVFWSFWLLAAGFSLGSVAVVGFGYLFQTFGPNASAEMYFYSIWLGGVPAAWITFAAVAGNTIFGLFDLRPFRRSVYAGLLTSANAGAVLILGTATRLPLAVGFKMPAGHW